jgi:hypothetical protein
LLCNFTKRHIVSTTGGGLFDSRLADFYFLEKR